MTSDPDPDGVRTVFLHVGTMKTGTTYLQSRFKQHRRELAADGIRYPLHQLHAVRDLFGRRGTLAQRDVRGAWPALLAELRAPGAEIGVVSMEYLSIAEPDRVADVVRQLGPADVHIVVTARDLVRVAAAQWQETIQNRAVWTWEAYADSLTAGPSRAEDAGAKFWRQHDLTRIIDDWSAVVGMDRMHLVTVPPSGAPADELWKRFCRVVGIDADRYRQGPDALRSNVGIDAASAELLRRINARLGTDLSNAAYLRHVKHLLGKQVLVSPGRASKPMLTVEQHDWASAYSERLVDRLGSSGLHVVGDLDDLLPTSPPPGPGTGRDEVSDAAVAAAATEVVVALLRQLDELEPLIAQQSMLGLDSPDAQAGQANRRRRRRKARRDGDAGPA